MRRSDVGGRPSAVHRRMSGVATCRGSVRPVRREWREVGMARYSGPRMRKVRALGPLPGLTRKEPVNQNAPGQHGGRWQRRRSSTYRLQLIEKQKIRFNYGLAEKKLRMYFEKAAAMKGETGYNLLQLIERRLDNVVARSGFVRTIPAARQIVAHGHIMVNDRRVDIPSYSLKVGDVVSLTERSMNLKVVADNIAEGSGIGVPAFIDVDPAKRRIIMKALPTREDVPLDVDVRMVVEYYSK